MKSNTENTAKNGYSSHGLLDKGACFVTYDDWYGLCVPMSWDPECEGALDGGKPVVIFPNRAAARKAIRISRRWYALRREQGGVVNSYFEPTCAKHVSIELVVFA